MRAVSLYIIVENIKLAPKKIGGLEISDNIDSDNRYLKGKIISKGDLCPPDEILKEGSRKKSITLDKFCSNNKVQPNIPPHLNQLR